MAATRPTDTTHDLDLDTWLRVQARRLLDRHSCIRDARFFRVSSSQPSLFIANLTAGLMASDHSDPDILLAKEVGGLIVERTQEGAACRAKHGTIDIRQHMLEGGGTSDRLIGHATVFGSTLFVYLLASAAKGDLTDTGHPEDSGNAATEVMRTVIRALSIVTQEAVPDHRLRCHFTDETRAARSKPQAAKLVVTARHHSALLVLRGTEWDLRKLVDSQIIDQLLGMAATERDLVVQRTVRGKASLLVAHRLPEPLGSTTPFTHGPHTATRTDPNGRTFTMVDDHLPVPVPGAGARLSAIVRAVIAAADEAEAAGEPIGWDAVAVDLSTQFGLMSRAPEHLNGNVPLHSLNDPGGALKRMLGEQHRTAWQTGRLPWETELAVEIDGLTDQLETAETCENGNRRVRAWIDCAIPPDLDVTLTEWQRLEEVLTKKGRPGRPSTGWERPLRGDRWTDHDHQWSIELNTSGMYRAERRPAAAATNANGTPKGWPRGRTKRDAEGVETIVSVNAHRLHSAIGADLALLATELQDQTATLRVRTRPARPKVRGDAGLTLRIELEETRRRLNEFEAFEVGARNERYRAAASGDDRRRAQAERDEEDFGRQRKEAQAAVSRLEERLAALDAPPESPTERVHAAVSTLEEVAAALQLEWASEGSVPPEVTAAARSLFGRTLRLEPGPTVALATWSVTVRVPLREGGVGRIQRSGTVKASSHASSALRNPAVVARRFLWDGESYESLGRDFGIDGSGEKKSYLVHRLKVWLAEPSEDGQLAVGSVDLRRALLDAPRSAKRAVYAWMTGRTAELIADGIDPTYLELIRTVYLSDPTAKWSESWTSGSFVAQRRLLALILSQPDPREGVEVLKAVRALDSTYNAVTALAGLRSGMPPAVHRSWPRVGPPPVERRRLFAQACPWDDCPGRHPRRGGKRPPFASHYLHVPEIPSGLLCPTCRRVSDPALPFARARFPEDYLRAHRRRTTKEDGTRTGTRIETARWAKKTVDPVV